MNKPLPDRAGRELPNNAAVEAYVLKSILLAEGEPGGRMLAVLSTACPPPLHRWFFNRDHKLVALALDAALRGDCRSDMMSIATVMAAMDFPSTMEVLAGRSSRWITWTDAVGGADVLSAVGGMNALSFDDANSTSSLDSFQTNAKHLRQLGDARSGITALRIAAEAMYRVDPRRGIAGVLADLQGQLSVLAGGGTTDRDVGTHLVEAMIEHDRRKAARDAGEITTATWGVVPALDALARFDPGSLTFLAAPPGLGKTSLGFQAAAASTNAGQHPGTVGYISLEMSGADLASILAGKTLGISPSAIRQGALLPERRQEVYELAETWRAAGNLRIRDPSSGRFTIDELCAWARHRQSLAGGRMSLLVVDYLGLIDGTDPRQSEYARLCEQTRRLKQLALELNIPLLVLCQMSREGRKAQRGPTGNVTPEPRLEDLRGSGSIEQDADAVVFIHAPTDDGGPCLPCELIVAKNRRGARGRIPVVFNRHRQEFVGVEVRRPSRAMDSAVSAGEDLYA